jgi:hypothetical protein
MPEHSPRLSNVGTHTSPARWKHATIRHGSGGSLGET